MFTIDTFNLGEPLGEKSGLAVPCAGIAMQPWARRAAISGRLPEIAERFGHFMVVGSFLVAGGVVLLHALTGLVAP